MSEGIPKRSAISIGINRQPVPPFGFAQKSLESDDKLDRPDTLRSKVPVHPENALGEIHVSDEVACTASKSATAMSFHVRDDRFLPIVDYWMLNG